MSAMTQDGVAGEQAGCVVVAAGQGTRLGADQPKAFVALDGRTLLEHAVQRVRDSGAVAWIVAVVPPGAEPQARRLLGQQVVVVPGGRERRDSVAAGIAALPDTVSVVLVHDAARCLAPPALVAAVVAAVRQGSPAVVPGVAVADTIKRVVDGVVAGTVDRAELRAVQTPQGFTRAVLQQAHEAAAGRGSDLLINDAAHRTDDAGLVEAIGGSVRVLPGHPDALKITTPADLRYAQWLLATFGQEPG
ncbi:MAG: 2-C-methyl-D-erythritol 4-phosphate cytidylyltransferase [Angustibacter sp.]